MTTNHNFDRIYLESPETHPRSTEIPAPVLERATLAFLVRAPE
jgi:hypothetical protein